ncbi:MAG: peroxiredoxin [Planctomycetota bacterium]
MLTTPVFLRTIFVAALASAFVLVSPLGNDPLQKSETKPAATRPAENKPASAPATLKIGDAAPAFRVADHTGKVRSLADFKGKRVILWFYPKANTSGCTKEGCGFRDRIADIEKLGATVLGVSFDDATENSKFVTDQKFNFALLCDTTKEMGLAYGAWSEGKPAYPARISYIIGKDGKIENIYLKVNVTKHAGEIVEWLEKNK